MLAWPMVISILELSITGRWEHFCACQEGPFQSLLHITHSHLGVGVGVPIWGSSPAKKWASASEIGRLVSRTPKASCAHP